jgi:hypothetical protein
MASGKVFEAVAKAADVPVEEVGDPEVVAVQGDVSWYVFPLADGRWAATDDAEVSPERVLVFATKREAVSAQRYGVELYDEGDPYRPRWVFPED